VAGLRLDDIDWRQGHVTIQASKSGRERRLPLPTDVGSALVSYLRDGRPKRPHRAIFLQARPPYRQLSGGVVTSVAQRGLKRAGVSPLRHGAHVFRHSAATQMVRRGATFKAVADVLGHACIETTAIYAKLDVDALARVSLPWPGGVR
jgi:site-specific recombinase XerD